MTEPTLETLLLKVIALGRQRCGLGFGKYPLGVRDAVEELRGLADTQAVNKAIEDFDRRLRDDS